MARPASTPPPTSTPASSSARRSILEELWRKAARAGLYGSLLATATLGATLAPLVAGSEIEEAADWHKIPWQDSLQVKLLQQLVRVDTTHETGNEINGARTIAAILEGAGIETTVVEMAGGKANLWAVLEGRKKEALVLHNHIDTDPIVAPDQWRYGGPFSGNIEGPFIYGRGTFDMKSVTAAQLYTMLSIKRWMDETGQRPERSLIFLATGSEEIGSEMGALFILRTQHQLTDRFWGVLTEGGVLEATSPDRIKYWGTSVAQKIYVDYELCASNKENLEEVVALLRENNDTYRGITLTEPVREFLSHYAHTRDHPDHRRWLADPERLNFDARSWKDVPLYQKALFRNELMIWPIQEANDGSFKVRMSLNLLPGADLETAERDLLPEWILHGMSMSRYKLPAAKTGSSTKEPLYQLIDQEFAWTFDDPPRGPYFLSFFANDSRFFRTLGVPSYGFSPFRFMADSLTINGPNEHITGTDFVDGTKLYLRVVKRAIGSGSGDLTQGTYGAAP